ncbi:pyridine nucleotide-disulfide oxidoreductase, partial [Escherichia coli]|nr:pyridine nucleotide-disulfide oxidoreductase [Escherichia coli]
RPCRPAVAASVPGDIFQIDVGRYTNPSALPPGDIVIVGNGQSGCQVAHELAKAGREVTLACGRAAWIPRRIGARDMTDWMVASGFPETPARDVPPEARFAANPIATGHGGGYDLNLRVLRAAGVALAGRFQGAEGGRLRFSEDLAESVAWSDTAQENFRAGMRKLASAKGWPEPTFPEIPPFDPTQTTEIDLSKVGAVIYATGYRPDYARWLPWPEAFDDQGFPHQTDGSSTTVPGLHFLGLHLLRKRKSSL